MYWTFVLFSCFGGYRCKWPHVLKDTRVCNHHIDFQSRPQVVKRTFNSWPSFMPRWPTGLAPIIAQSWCLVSLHLWAVWFDFAEIADKIRTTYVVKYGSFHIGFFLAVRGVVVLLLSFINSKINLPCSPTRKTPWRNPSSSTRRMAPN